MSGRIGEDARARGPLSRAILVLPVVLLTALGCASIIGLDDYTVAGGGGRSGSAGNVGTGGRSGGNGEGGSSADAGSPPGTGQSGSVGEAGTTSGAGQTGNGDAGAAGGGGLPHVVGCDGVTSFQPNEQLVRSCLLRAGCDPTFNPVRTVSTCVTYNTQAALAGESCNLNSTTCEDFENCEHVGVAHDDLCGGNKKTRCVGGLAVNCGNYTGGDRFFDCGAMGATCGTFPLSSTDPTLYADCKYDVAPDSCAGAPDSDTSTYCHSAAGQADVRYYCWGGQAYGNSCSAFATCQDSGTDPGQAGCFFDTQSCTSPATPTCNKGVATVCSSGSLFKYDCGSVGLSCAITSATEYCLAPGCKAADVDSGCTESCSLDGSTLTFCYGGAPYTVNCEDYGFTQCRSGVSDDGAPFAACRF